MELPERYVIFDTEYTAWEGSHARNWSALNEYREIIQLGAILVAEGRELASFLELCRPTRNPQLSTYITELTGVTQAAVDAKGMSFMSLVQQFAAWAGTLPIFAYGNDGLVVAENCVLNDVTNPFPSEQFHDIREYFATFGVDPTKYMSSTIPRAFNATPPPAAHDALNDARSILVAVNAARNFADTT
jgi:inhibitor of KinA sporulation pathway (predicted exonuclease)